ncbi:hypothetical protein A11A3_04320 [Alcanivorax hongdengensis A-11-3]|uniref:ER-bound oxygenase mpaB/mpaB'/Rubber oxygenase catalytic domain-containing protein n=1 Tax=Alcanivorax hongdengensis A-11-3 TaxID=1177179 RepID=L0WEL8_9GAMM|nr:oxygenase MpaB family protein [Alcanivorax hongdengensis]EKF75174.1 hypothetical protein A11A3_04320 [Alcanivorax hongdengensis A-11-3]
MTASARGLDESRIQREWPEPMTAKQLDQQYPGIFDGVMLLSGAANIIMQLALPGVGYGVKESRVESGNIFRHPIKRSRTTFTYLAVAMLGTTEEKLAYRKAVNRSHAHVHSTEHSPVEYNAFDPELQLWVAACLYWGFTDTNEKLRGRWTREQKQRFYDQARPLGTTLQVRPDMWPRDLDAFEQYWQAGLQKLQIDEPVRQMLEDIARLKFLSPISQRLFGNFNLLMTAGFLPPQVREKMKFHWSDKHQQRFQRHLRLIGGFSRLLPRPIRQMPYNLIMWGFRRRLATGKPLV